MSLLREIFAKKRLTEKEREELRTIEKDAYMEEAKKLAKLKGEKKAIKDFEDNTK